MERVKLEEPHGRIVHFDTWEQAAHHYAWNCASRDNTINVLRIDVKDYKRRITELTSISKQLAERLQAIVDMDWCECEGGCYCGRRDCIDLIERTRKLLGISENEFYNRENNDGM